MSSDACQTQGCESDKMIEFKKNSEEAYILIDKGINLVTDGKKSEAAIYFEKALELLDRVLSVKVEGFTCSAEQIQVFTEMQSKMRSTRMEVLTHFAHTPSPSAASQNIADDAPPSYQECVNSYDNTENLNIDIAGGRYPNLEAIADDSMGKISPDLASLQSPKSGEMIFLIENGVQIFFIHADGSVTSTSNPSFLAIFTLAEPIQCEGAGSGLRARGILQVGEWNYPLVPAKSPVLHSFYGAYMFPDLSNTEPGTNVGILIPDKCDKDTRELFETILSQMTSFQEQEVPKGKDAIHERSLIEKSAGQRIAEGSVAISKGVTWGAEKLGNFISFSSDKIKESLTPEGNVPVDPKLVKTAKVARNVSGNAVKISGFLVNQVGKATMALGRTVAPTIRKHGTIAIGHLTGQKEKEANSQVSGVLEVASGAVKGAATVYMSLEGAAMTLASSLADNTVKVVSHKYGDDAATLTGNTLYAVGQTAAAGYNISSLGAKGIAKRTAKDAGKALIAQQDERSKRSRVELMEVEDDMPPPPPPPSNGSIARQKR